MPIFTARQAAKLADARRDTLRLPKGEKKFYKVGGYKRRRRKQLRGVGRRLALIERLDLAVQAICSDYEKNGALPAAGRRHR